MCRPESLSEEQEAEFLRILGGKAEQVTQKAAALIEFLSSINDEGQLYLYSLLLRKYGRKEIESDREIMGPLMDSRRFEELARTYGDIVNATIKLIVMRRLSPNDAAQRLIDLIASLNTNDEKVFALSYTMADDAIPYTPLPAHPDTPMTDEIANALLSRVRDKQDVVRIIKRAGFPVPTEAQLLLQLILSEEDQRTREALFSWILFRDRQEAERQKRRILEALA